MREDVNKNMGVVPEFCDESPVDADGGDFRYEAGDIFDTVNKDVESVSTAAQIF